jgi:cytochrome P450
MNEIAWEPKIPVTAVPYVERAAAKAMKIGGVHIKENQRIRLYLDAFSSHGSAGLDHYFGTGRHGCLGKAISQKAWQILTSELSRIEKKIRINKKEYRGADYLFNFLAVVDISFQDE